MIFSMFHVFKYNKLYFINISYMRKNITMILILEYDINIREANSINVD
jgi:hypothetical protein